MSAAAREARSLDASSLSTGSVRVSRASGCWLFTEAGERFFDATGGSGAVNLGHQHPRVVAAIHRQADRLLHTGWNLRSTVRDALVEKLGHFSPYSPCGVLFTVTGAEGVEAALKIARAHTGRRTVVAFDRSYHGKTAGALAVTWRTDFRRFSPEAQEAPVRFIPYPLPEEGSDSDAVVRALEEVLAGAAAEGAPAAAVILEPVQAAEGFLPGGEPFLREVLRLARKHGAVSIFDEIITG
ncbi:MAG TPA: aminotransferase class III-fold pyridoxal phosphate-dependent enzyme, partial [Longimicrobiaceae bacterium]|nr:aminotransferase class III-fold pyridoxal phosphate-dependent enzyme [Longimicrobiaceae bacterium]